jgi:hypothetical protein
MKLNIIFPVISSFILFCCGTDNYILKEETPGLDTGFYHFRWHTPMSILDSEFQKMNDATPRLDLNRYSTLCYSNTHFLDELIKECQFSFNDKGLNSVLLLFDSNSFKAENDLLRICEKLSDIYGKPQKIHNETNRDFIIKYFWDFGKLELTLKRDYSITIRAASMSPFLRPIHDG